MTTSDLEAKYSPMPVPERNLDHRSIRDDVRRTIRRHNFRPSKKLYTSIDDMYELFLRDTQQKHDPGLKERFRSALGRVLRPPAGSGEYALSFAADVTRFHRLLSLVSPACASIDPVVQMREYKRDTGVRCRDLAENSPAIEELRAQRRQKAEAKALAPVVEDEPQRVSFRYVDEFMTLNCAEDIIRLKLFPNGKELAESMSAYGAVRNYLHVHDKTHEEQQGVVSFRDANVILLAVGDGVTPRTAGLFAFRSTWRCISIDPLMRSGEWETVSNLETHRAKVQDVAVEVGSELVVVVMLHCHVSLAETLSCLVIDGTRWDTSDAERSARLRRRVAVVSCACCNFDEVQRFMPDGSPPDEEFVDYGVPSPMRTMRVWKHVV